MHHQTFLGVLKKILSAPTAPFHEYHVRAQIRALLQPLPGVSLSEDPAGNLLATYRRGRSRPRWVLGAHMDHPGWVRPSGNPTGDWQFLGGMPERYLKNRANQKQITDFGGFAMWDLPALELRGSQLHGRACDDLLGCAAIVCTLLELSKKKADTCIHAAFTRAEEVGFVGATQLAANWPLPKTCPFLSIETSNPTKAAKMGAGPIIRAGDRLTVFDTETTARLLAAASASGQPHQRALLDKGACEATAMGAFGIPAAGISIPLGNIHNCGPRNRVACEFIELADLKSLIAILIAACTANAPAPNQALRKKLKQLVRENLKHEKNAEPFWQDTTR